MNDTYSKLLNKSKFYTHEERCALFDYQFTGYKLINRLTDLIYRENAYNILKEDEEQFNLVKRLYRQLRNTENLFEGLKFDSLENFISSGLKEAEIIDKMKHHYKTDDEIIVSRVRLHTKEMAKNIMPLGPSNFISTTNRNNAFVDIALDLYESAGLPTTNIYGECYRVKEGTPAIAVIQNPKLNRFFEQCLEDEVLLFKDTIKYCEVGKKTFYLYDSQYDVKYYEIEPNNI